MNRPFFTGAMTAVLATTCLCGTRVVQADELTDLLRKVPADFPQALVLVNAEKLNATVLAVQKRLSAGEGGDPVIEPLSEGLGAFGSAVDYSKPIVIAGKGLWPRSEPVMWASVPEFTEKVKTLEGVVKEEETWRIPLGDEVSLYVRLSGTHAVASRSQERLAKAFKVEKSLAEALKPRLEVLGGRDLLLHNDFDPIRAAAVASVAQAAQMAPMLAMGMAGQVGADPAMLGAVADAVFEAARQFVEQVNYVDLTFGLSAEAADLTIATGYREGPIHSYLLQQKPASRPFFQDLADQPYFLASGAQVGSSDSKFIDYVTGKISETLAGAPQGSPETVKKTIEAARELYQKVTGGALVLAMSPEGMKVAGHYLSNDPKAVFELVKKTMEQAKAAAGEASGAGYTALGSKNIGGVPVEQYSLEIDQTDPNAAVLGMLYGENPRFGIGMVKERVAFSMGGDKMMAQVFGGAPSKPLSSSKYVAATVAALPSRNNAVILLDVASGLAALGPLLGMGNVGDPGEVPPGPAIGLSVSIAGDPARLDVHVPIRAVERIMQAVAPDEPM